MSSDSERIYPCCDCGKMRSKDEGGTTFSCCDECWDKQYPKDSERKAAEEAYRDAYGISPKENPEFDIFKAGRSSALKELEQIAREAFDVGWYASASFQHPATQEQNVLTKEFQDYWQKKTESKEVGND